MHIGSIYKSLIDNHFVIIQSFATMINKEYEDSNDLLVVVSPLMLVDGFVSSDPVRCLIGKQSEIEDKYISYLKNEIGMSEKEYNRIIEEDIKPKIEEQEKIDMKEIDKMLSNVDIEKFKEDINKIIEDSKEG